MNTMSGGGGDHATAMEATFPHRRRMIVKEKLSMDQLTRKFPPLFTADGVRSSIVDGADLFHWRIQIKSLA